MTVENQGILNVDMPDAVGRLAEFAERARSGQDVLLLQGGVPIAKVVGAIDEAKMRRPGKPGALDGEFFMAEDFDELPEEEARAFGMID